MNGGNTGVHITILVGEGSVHTMRLSPSGGVTDCAASFPTRADTGSSWPQRASPLFFIRLFLLKLALTNEMSFICPGFSKINIILRHYASKRCLAGLISSFALATLHRSTPRSLLESLRYLPAQFDVVGCRESKHHLQNSNVICTWNLRCRHQSKESCNSNLITR